MNEKKRYLKYEYSGTTFQDHRKKMWKNKAQTYQSTGSWGVWKTRIANSE